MSYHESESDERKRDEWAYKRGQELRNNAEDLRQSVVQLYDDDHETALFTLIRSVHPESKERPEQVIDRWVRWVIQYEETMGMWRDE